MGPVAQVIKVELREGLARLGWVEGRNLRTDFRFAAGDSGRLAAYAEELVKLRPDAILAAGGPAAQAVQQRTQVIPILFFGGDDAVDNNYVSSVRRPTGNMTGFPNAFTSEGGKWLELLKEAVPRITRVAIIFDANLLPSDSPMLAVIDDAAPHFALTIVRIPLRDPVDIERISAFAADPDGAMLMIGVTASAPVKRDAIERLAVQYRLPAMYGGGNFVEDGLLMTQGPDINDLFRGVASYIDHILRGSKPGDLPVQYPTRFELVVNLRVATAIGLTIPETFLVRADKVIE